MSDEHAAFEAGPELDALVADEVMGWEFIGCVGGVRAYKDRAISLTPWSPSTDIAAAWEVVEKLRSTFPDYTVTVSALHSKRGTPLYWCEMEYTEDPEGEDSLTCEHADSATLAICRAALKAVRVIRGSPSDDGGGQGDGRGGE